MDDSTRQSLLEMVQAISNVRDEIAKLKASLIVLKIALGIYKVGADRDQLIVFLQTLEDLEQLAYSPTDEEQKKIEAAILRALKHWTPKPSPDS